MTNQKSFLSNKLATELVLRAMRPEDSDAVARIYLESRQHHFSWVKHPLLADFVTDSHGERVMVAVFGNEIVGFASLSEWDHFLHLLFVKEGWQRYGIGKCLLNWARQVVNEPLELKVVVANLDAQRFYDREGFVPVRKSQLVKPQNVTYRDGRK
jgi:GNAT superfamily N-acetyltransferase